MIRHDSSHFSLCTNCTHEHRVCQKCSDFARTLEWAIQGAENATSDDFEVSGYLSLDCNGRDCLIGWKGSPRRVHVFGGISKNQIIDDLADLADGMIEAASPAKGPNRPISVPASIQVLETALKKRHAA